MFTMSILGLGTVGLLGVIGLLFAVATVASAVEIVRAYEKRTVTVFGEYKKTLEPGINIIPPFVSHTTTFDMRTHTVDVPQQEAITRDNSPVTADAVIYIRVMNAKKAFLEVDDFEKAVKNLAQTTLRAVIGDMELDDTLNKRQEINARIRNELDGPTDEWGVRVESVEVREVMPSKDVTNAMEKQTSAERNRRAMILEAQGQRQSAIEEAEGEKQSNIIRAQGEKMSQILEAQGDSISTVLRARAAESMGERAVIEKSLDTLVRMGEGESTKFVIPQELTSLVGRYGQHLTGADANDGESVTLDSLGFDDEARELLGLDNIEEILNQMDDEDIEGPGSAIEENLKSAEDVIAAADEKIDEPPVNDVSDVENLEEGDSDSDSGEK